MRRTTISLEAQIAAGGEKKAVSEGRSFSSYVARLIARDVGLNTEQADQNRLAAVTAQLAADPAALTQAESLLAKRRRARRRSA